MCFYRGKNLAGVLQVLHESRRVHLVHHGPDILLTHAPDELRDADAFERSWKVAKTGLCHRAEQVLPRRFRSNIWPVRRINVGALLEL